MCSKDDGSTREVPPSEHQEQEQPEPSNAFEPSYLRRLNDRDEPPTALEAEFAGPWSVESLPAGLGYGLYRAGESPRIGHVPVAVFGDLWRAEQVAALLPLLARDSTYRFREQPDADGWYAIESREAWGAVVGRLVVHDPAVLAGLHVLEGLMREPMALALLLETCGKTALERVGAILAEK
jgi:hypothetical protein